MISESNHLPSEFRHFQSSLTVLFKIKHEIVRTLPSPALEFTDLQSLYLGTAHGSSKIT